MQVAYCDNCGHKIDDDADSLSKRADDGKRYCAQCAPLYKDTTTALQKVQIPSKALGPDEPTGEFAPVTESALGQNVMKFYFCETCSKRITDKQILEGLGRDKKLKGIYCKDCAVGVTTMEFTAIKEVPAAIASSPPSSLSPATGARGSAARILAVSRSAAKLHGPPGDRVQPNVKKAAQSGAPIKAIAAGVVALLGILAIVLKSTPSSQSKLTDRAPVSAPIVAPANSNVESQPVVSGKSREETRSAIPAEISKREIEIATKSEPDDNAGRIADHKGAVNEYTITLQQGQPVKETTLAAYEGTKCGHVFGYQQTTQNRRCTTVMQIGEIRHWKGLISFAVYVNEGGPLPDDAEVLEAKLYLYRFGIDIPISLRRITKSWKPDEVTYNTVVADESFFAVHPYLKGYQQKIDGWYDFDCTQVLKDAHKDHNQFGWVIEATDRALTQCWVSYNIASATYDKDPALRPKLVLRVRKAGQSGH